MASNQVVVDQADLDRLHDRLYALESALDDVASDLAELQSTSTATSRALAYAAALRHLQEAAEDLRGTVVEPVTS